MKKSTTSSNLDNLEIDLLIDEMDLKNFSITIDGIKHLYGTFELSDLEQTIDMLKYCCTHANISQHLTFPEIIDTCKFLSAEDKEYCKLKYGI